MGYAFPVLLLMGWTLQRREPLDPVQLAGATLVIIAVSLLTRRPA